MPFVATTGPGLCTGPTPSWHRGLCLHRMAQTETRDSPTCFALGVVSGRRLGNHRMPHTLCCWDRIRASASLTTGPGI